KAASLSLALPEHPSQGIFRCFSLRSQSRKEGIPNLRRGDVSINTKNSIFSINGGKTPHNIEDRCQVSGVSKAYRDI
ncbi:MAG: hypothetical protein ABIG67_02070, partial [Pseudomonadota bacterium]